MSTIARRVFAMKHNDIHVVRVTPDDGTHQLWAAATPREEAVDSVLNVIPEGWCAHLLDETFRPRAGAVEDIRRGDVWQLNGSASIN
jgi:hypothetical protein